MSVRRILPSRVLAPIAFLFSSVAACLSTPSQDAAAYVDAVAKINTAHLRQPGKNTEAQLSQQMPATAKLTLKRLLESKPAPDLSAALARCGEAALDLDLPQDFEAIRTRLAAVDAAAAAKLETALSRPPFILPGIGELPPGYLEKLANASMPSWPATTRSSASRNSQRGPEKSRRCESPLDPPTPHAPFSRPNSSAPRKTI